MIAVSSGYGTEATVESIWNTSWETARFNFINVSIGTRFNFWITGDAATDITDTKVTGLLAAETNDLFSYWNSMAKIEKHNNPWDFIQVWLRENLQGDQFYRFFRKTIKTCQEILYGIMDMSTRNLPDASDRTY